MKRFVSIDFLRGLAIIMMIVLHIISDLLDLDALLNDMGNLTLLELVLLFVLPFLGGLAGFFLMISSIGNAISMQKQLQKGRTNKEVAIRQVTGGIVLLIFAMLSEGILGYHGMIGEIFKHLDNPSNINWSVALYRGYYFETIHTIAWCVIINGFVHALLTQKGKWKDLKHITKFYLLLAAGVLILTPFMWWLADVIVPGYPYGTDPVTGLSLELAEIGKSSFGDFVIRFFLGPLAAQWEPVFPYLAASFLGSIIGSYLAQEKEEIDTRQMKKYLKFGLIMFLIGALGFILNLVLVIIDQGIDPALDLYIKITEHRYWTTEHGVPFIGWFFQFLLLNGFGICATIIIIRLVEFRGKAEPFATKTKFIRRLGLVAFTSYNIQFIYNGVFFVVSSIVGSPYVRMGWGPTITALLVTLGIYYLLTLGWEKIGYIGSMEWMIATIAAYLIPGKKQSNDQKWWAKGKIDVENVFYHAEWINIIPPEAIEQNIAAESRFINKVGRLGILFFPFSFVAFNAQKILSKKIHNNETTPSKIGMVGIIFFLIWVILFTFLKLGTLGISF